MFPKKYCSLRISDLKKFIEYCEDSDLVVFKSRNNFVFEGYGIENSKDCLILSFESTPVFHKKGNVFKEYKSYENCFIDEESNYPFLDWMIFDANKRLKNKGDFIEFYSVDDVLMGRLGFFDGFYVKDNKLVILKDSDVCSSMDVGGCSYFVDLELVCYMRFCLC